MVEYEGKTWELEDQMSEAGVFINGLSGKPAHSDSYMTCLEYGALTKLLSTIPDTDKPMWQVIARREWYKHVSPSLMLVAREVIRLFGEPIPQ